MRSSDGIFQLIKSLTRQEKSYFKKFAGAFISEEGNNYLLLFDEIASQIRNNNYDEQKIKNGNYSGKFIPAVVGVPKSLLDVV